MDNEEQKSLQNADYFLLTEREKMLINDVAKYRQKIETMKLKISEDEVSYAKQRAQIETDSAAKIEVLEKECAEVEKEKKEKLASEAN